MMPLILAVGVVVVVFLGWMLYRRFGSDRLAAFSERRRGSSLVVGRGEFVDGNRHLPVALALTDRTFFYENTDMEASLDREFIQEVEYDTELATGAHLDGGQVLRLRSASQSFEFVVPKETVPQWKAALPPHRGADVETRPTEARA